LSREAQIRASSALINTSQHEHPCGRCYSAPAGMWIIEWVTPSLVGEHGLDGDGCYMMSESSRSGDGL